MATKSFKGFQLVALATFNGDGFTKDKNTLYFVRTSGEKGKGTDGFLYFNGKKYGTAEDAKAALTAKYGDLKIGKKDATIAEYVAEQLKDIKGVTKTDFDAVKAESAANKAAIEKLNGTEDVVGSVAKAVKDAKTSLVGTATEGYQTLGELETKIKKEAARAEAAEEKVKTDLLGDAADEYNTLGKLEDKIQAEASRADAAEKANAAAAAAAKTAADNAQATADAKVKSVEGTNTVVATTTEHAVSVSLKTSDKGNVKFTQDTDGLSANVTIPDATVTGVKAGDKVLALEGTELTSTISLSVDATAGEDGKKYIRLKGIGGADLGKIDTADFVKDGMLENAELVTNPSGQTEGTYIVLTWNTAAGKKAMPINVTSLIDVYTAGNGLNLSDHEFSVDTTKIATKASVEKLNATHAKDGENFKTVATEVSEGIAGIAETSKASAEGEGEADVKVTVTTKSGSVSAVAVDSSRLAQKVTNNTDAITKLNGNSGVTGSVDQKIKSALEAGAVTLEVKDNDAYLGVSATTGANGTVYTLASNEAVINNAIKAEADKVKVSVASAEDAYVTASVDKAGRVITLREKIQAVANADANSAETKGLAEASDVKAYVDGKVSGKNVSAAGDTYVSATAADNKVTVAATGSLKSAVTKANSAVQSVNGVSATAVTLNATNIEVGAGVGGQEATAKVNEVLADIYDKIGLVKVSSTKKTITVDTTGRIIDVNRQIVENAQAAGHVALECGDDGALYGVMYYSGDDVDAQ